MTENDGDGVRGDSLPLGTTLDLLANSRRREALYYLRDATDGPVSLERLAERLAVRERERGDDRPEPDESAVSRATAVLVHDHLPKLSDAGVVEYDRRSGTVRYRERALAEHLLDAAATLENGDAGG